MLRKCPVVFEFGIDLQYISLGFFVYLGGYWEWCVDVTK